VEHGKTGAGVGVGVGGVAVAAPHILQRLFTVSNGPDKWQPTRQTRCSSI